MVTETAGMRRKPSVPLGLFCYKANVKLGTGRVFAVLGEATGAADGAVTVACVKVKSSLNLPFNPPAAKGIFA